MSAPATLNPLLQTRTASLEELRELAAAGRLYAVIDACDTPAVPEKARELGETQAVSLYRGTADEQYWAFAPYLFAVDGDVLDWIAADLWTQPWGIFAVADGDIEAVRRHFRRFLLVQAPDGEQWYFRFYDPRVLPTFLETADEQQLGEFFPRLQALLIPDGSPRLAGYSAPALPAPRISIRLARPR
ncbi:DUF4123 domain-containing protein [Longimicrobium sp.]|uniref:DUF4123 domain-containing protein n=1 Tax=Longimicrobium sp. TaxID=2029185 RepID=UPI003B3B05BE